MLPERLSNGLCSLREGENRACLAVRMVFDAGRPQDASHTLRARPDALGRQAGLRAGPGRHRRQARTTTTGPLLEPILKPLWAAYAAMLKGRERRSPAGHREPRSAGSCIDTDGEVASIRPARRAWRPTG